MLYIFKIINLPISELENISMKLTMLVVGNLPQLNANTHFFLDDN
jgi:hypothetical protein